MCFYNESLNKHFFKNNQFDIVPKNILPHGRPQWGEGGVLLPTMEFGKWCGNIVMV